MTSSPNTLEDGWIAWNGGESPVSGNTLVEIKVRTAERGEIVTLFPRMAWANAWGAPDIIAYRVVQQEPGK